MSQSSSDGTSSVPSSGDAGLLGEAAEGDLAENAGAQDTSATEDPEAPLADALEQREVVSQDTGFAPESAPLEADTADVAEQNTPVTGSSEGDR